MSRRPGETEEQAQARESNPNSESREGLSGDLGVSSERTGGFEGVENTGTVSSAGGETDGASPTYPEGLPATGPGGGREVDPPDDERPDPVEGQHADPSRNPGHSHG